MSRWARLWRCGWRVVVLDFGGVFAPSLVFGRGGGLLGAKQSVPRSEVDCGIQALHFAPRKTPLSTAQKGGRTPWSNAAICGLQWSKSHFSKWSLWSGYQPLWIFAGTELADRLAAKRAGAHHHAGWTVKKISAFATVTLHMAEQYPTSPLRCPTWQSRPLEECIRLRTP